MKTRGALFEEETDKHIDLKESLEVMQEIYELAVQRMKRGVEKHGTEMIRKPFEELEEELADAFNYICMGYIKVLKVCGGYRDKWSLKDLPDVQKRRIKNVKKSKENHRV